MELTEEQMKKMYGKSGRIDSARMIMFLIMAAGMTGVLKILFSARGKISFFGITIQWGN
ncbi:MAG: hypothetical protein IJM15_00655 [Erysipelotrichaceae bacterium]|nr:hypothetical protein [Erysipelotrichaceae bacterium]